MIILDILKSELNLDPKLPFPRCEHRSPTGRQCTQPVCSTSPDFCFTHKPKPDELLIAELTEAAGTLSTSEEIHNFLKKVTLLRVQGRITPKESGNYTYLCQNLQRGLRDIAFHQKLREERAERETKEARSKDSFCGWNLPRPDRSDPSDSPAAPESTESPTASTAPTAEPVPSFAANEQENSFVGAGQARPVLADIGSAPAASNENPPPNKSTHTKKSSSIPSPDSSALRTYAATEPPPPPKPLPRDFYNHFFPVDPAIPSHLQDKNKNIPHPDEAECARRNARRGFPNSRFQRKLASTVFHLWRR